METDCNMERNIKLSESFMQTLTQTLLRQRLKLRDSSHTIHKMPSLETATSRTNILTYILQKWYTFKTHKNACEESFVKITVCLQSYSKHRTFKSDCETNKNKNSMFPWQI